MRFAFAAMVAVLSLSVPARSDAQTSLDGFGGLPMNQLSTLGDTGVPFDFGGRVSFEVVPGLQLMGEFGRMGNMLPTFVETGLAFTPFDLRASAFYGEGGIRLLAAPRSSVSPYVEGSAGVAHLSFSANGLNGATNAVIRAALNLVDTRDPIVGFGGGVLMHGGPLQFDLGYRYKRILPDSALTSFISTGQKMDSHQVRFGVGVRF